MRLKRSVAAIGIACALVAPVAATRGVAAAPARPVNLDSTQKLHPLLQYGAAVEPSTVVRVIVQKTTQAASASNIAASVQGEVVEAFNLIPAFVMDVAQGRLPTLATSPKVRYISPDGLVQVIPSVGASPAAPGPNPPKPKPPSESANPVSWANLATTYPFDTGATQAWSGQIGRIETGAGTTVAVVDSGIDANHPDFVRRVVAVNVNRRARQGPADGYGHGTHVAGIIGGRDPSGQYLGMAPNTLLVSVKVADDVGNATESDVLRGLDWVESYRAAYHIQVVNLSVSAGIAESYANSPIDAAVERLWHDRVAVVTAAGNLGTDEDATWYAPGNDPMVITVGCLDENHTRTLSDDSLCAISSRGVTQDGFAKPDLVAPGRRIVSTLATGSSGRGALLGTQFTDRITGDGAHIRLSGTSMAASVVSGAIALLLEAKPDLRPDQVKRLLTTTSRAYPGKADNAGMLDVARALQSVGRVSSSVQIPMPASGAAAPAGKSTLLWDGGHWANAYFDGARWSTAYADGAHWDAGFWDGARWASVYGDGARWSEGGSLDGARWGEIANWDSSAWSDVGAYD